MTLSQLLSQVDGIKPNAFSAAQKTAWVNDLEDRVWTQILLQSPFDRPALDAVSDSSAGLLLPDGWRRLYHSYLGAMIDYANGEYTKYQNAVTLYNTAAQELGAWYAQRYRPADRPFGWAVLGTLAYNDVHPAAMGRLRRGSLVLAARCRVETAFNGSVTALKLGSSDRPSALCGAGDASPGTTGVYVRARLTDFGREADTELYADLTAGGTPTAGKAVFEILVQTGEE